MVVINFEWNIFIFREWLNVDLGRVKIDFFIVNYRYVVYSVKNFK